MKSILVFTIHKAASMFLHKLTTVLVRDLGIDYYSINDDKYNDRIKSTSWKEFIEGTDKFGCYGPIRIGGAEPSIPDDLDPYSLILHVRDPRDVLTSLYFSHTYSHPRKVGRFNPSAVQRKQWEERGIDKVVLEYATEYKQRYEILCANLLGRENTKLIKYEQMVLDYHTWLGVFLSAFSHISLKPRKPFQKFRSQSSLPRIHKKLYKKFHREFYVSSENKFKHKRQITPGDHLEKLSPQTIDELNRQFHDILVLLDYPI
jgi:hypothetical protein